MFRKLISLLLVLCIPLFPYVCAEDTAQEMSLLVLSVGKADCMLLRSGGDIYMIDTGKSKRWPSVYDTLIREGVTHLTGVILTHTDTDHAGGLKKLIESGIAADHVYASPYYNKKESKHPAVRALRKTDMSIEWLAAGTVLPLGEGSLTVLGPLSHNTAEENCNSLVLLAEAAGGSILLTGDMEFPEEAELLGAGMIPHADVLKVANHGEADATSEAFIHAVTPSVAVISTDTSEEPDTPAPRVLRLLNARNIRVLQTQQSAAGVRVVIRDGQILADNE